MMKKELNPTLQAVLEYGPLAGYLVAYLIYRNATFQVGGAEYSGFVAVTAAFIPVFLIATSLLWALTGRIARIQLVAAGMLVVFGGLGA